QAMRRSPREVASGSRVLVVGAGGIGCELLKNLVVSGFRRISIIDLDTIDVSNLNRQFLFRKEHVGQSKALVAKQSVLKYGRDADITAYHDSVLEEKYGVDFFSGFDIVLIALDNRAARNHVNRLCLAANVPLVESGSAGYLGQVTVIRKGVTACYECKEQQKQKSYPACTIRNTPSEPIHCVVWAKYLFSQLFGEADPDQDVAPDTEDPELSSSSSTTPAVANGSQANEQQSQKQTTRSWAEATGYDPSRLLKKLFADDIRYLLTMSVLWQRPGRRAPTPLTDEQLDGSGDAAPQSDGYQRDHAVWSAAQCCHVFRLAVDQLRRRYAERSSADDYLVFDKDDQAAMDFPNPKCYVCAPQPQVTLRCDPSILTVGALRDRVLKAELAMVAPDVEIEGRGVILVSSEAGETESNDPQPLARFGIGNHARLRCDDFLQRYNLLIIIAAADPADAEQRLPDGVDFQIVGDLQSVQATAEAAAAPPPATSGRKRRSEAVESGPLGSGEAKKARLLDEADDDDELEIVAAPKSADGASSQEPDIVLLD
uniref:ThiF domain-containing protein n=1 Tax=Macrostomum lignano TaxID=282301 RepID=A0A1I8GQY1_9PLAT